MTQIILEYDNWSVCAICFQKVTEDRFDCCTTCGSEFHEKHLQSWLLIDNTCPVCRSTIQPKKRYVTLPFHTHSRIYKDPRNHRFLQVSNVDASPNRNPMKQLAKYPMSTIQPIQIGYSNNGFFEHLINSIMGLESDWKGRSTREKLVLIVNLILFFLLFITPIFVTLIINSNFKLFIRWIVVIAILMISAAWLDTNEAYDTRNKQLKTRLNDNFKL